MVTYSQLQHLDLANLNAAAGDFESMVRNWDLSTKMQNEVIGPVQQSGWTGPSSEAAASSLTRTRDQIHAAFEEASAIARTLREAHDELAAAKKDLQTAVQHAADQGLTVDGEGSVHWPPATDPADKKDPDYAKSHQANAQAAADAIGKAIERATEADTAAASALAGDTGSDSSTFNGNPVGSLAEAEAKQASQILSLGSKATDAQLAQLQTLLQHHSGDSRFAAAFYGGQDPATFLASYGAMAQSGDFSDSAARKASIKGIQDGLGLTLATATDSHKQPHVSDDWEQRLRKAGAAQIPLDPKANPASSPYGYQILGNILRHGDYDAHFINPIAEHVTQLTNENPGRWDAVAAMHGAPFQEFQFTGVTDEKGNVHGFNPMSSVLEALGHSPEAATKFFSDPPTTYNPDGSVKSHGGENKYFDMLTDSGQRSLLRDMPYPLRPNPGTADAFEVGALGHALEAATTGRAYDNADAPLAKHTPEMAGLTQKIFDKYGVEGGPEQLHGEKALFSAMNGSLGNITAAYMGDVQAALEGPGAPAMTGAPANLDDAKVRRLLDVLGRDPDAYTSIAAGQQAYTTVQIEEAIAKHGHGSQSELQLAVENAVKPGGQVTGLVTSAMADEVYVKHAADDEDFNKGIDDKKEIAAKVWEFTGGKALERAPIAGEGVNFVVEKIMDGVADSYKVDTRNEADDQAKAAVADAKHGAQRSVMETFDRATAGSGIDPAFLEQLRRRAGQVSDDGYTSGAAGPAGKS
ncbi:hypothetical protein RMN57_05825 [Kitasatospora sp. CM 4170]|uniref:DUF6571 family protein n=1 Tax=Kitasatospora aburaviensis TaxID=67265 RepID=A0ABW1EY75_9ACTN|nr:DUF6571 family protein [Kitasatospora sp. CM 4170]WNM44264.1 hypothetical protein RMN57_05825 [Kitasatospora sp. CM 4170]